MSTIIPMTTKYDGTTLTTEVEIRTYSRYVRREVNLGIGAVPRGRSGRKVHQGPMVEGPWAFTFPLATIIAAHPLPQAPVVLAEVGDRFTVDGVEYVLTDDNPWAYPTLTAVEG